MTQRPDLLRLSITDPATRDGLRGLVIATDAIGRNGVPSVSELVRRIGVAYDYAPGQVAILIRAIFQYAAEADALAGEVMPPADTERDPFVRDAGGNVIGVRLAHEDGAPVTLTDLRRADPNGFWQFAVAAVGGTNEEE